MAMNSSELLARLRPAFARVPKDNSFAQFNPLDLCTIFESVHASIVQKRAVECLAVPLWNHKVIIHFNVPPARFVIAERIFLGKLTKSDNFNCCIGLFLFIKLTGNGPLGPSGLENFGIIGCAFMYI